MLPSQKIVWKKGGLPVENNSSNLTEGSIGRRLITFAIPYLIANFVQALYGAVDMAVVGWFANSAGISAVSVGSQVMQIVTSMVSGLTMGGTILIAQYFGAKLEKDTKETISTMLTMFAAAVFVCPLGFIAAANPAGGLRTGPLLCADCLLRHPVYLWLQRHQRHAAGARGL